MQIRDAILPDARGIAEVHIRAWQHAYRGIMPGHVLEQLSVAACEQFWLRQLGGQTRRSMVAVVDGRIAGWVSHGPARDADVPVETGEIYGIYLDPDRWRCGIGRSLWQAATQRLAEEGFNRLNVWVLEANEPARRFYEAIGGSLDTGPPRTLERHGTRLPEVRYWFAMPQP